MNNPEANEIPLEELEAAGDMYDQLIAGTFYEREEQARESLTKPPPRVASALHANGLTAIGRARNVHA